MTGFDCRIPQQLSSLANFNTPFDFTDFREEAQRILDELKTEIGWMYETLHTDGKAKGFINYTVWSEVFSCPDCGGELVFLNEALDRETDRVREQFPCPHCSAELTKDNLRRRMETSQGTLMGEEAARALKALTA
jgi:hypothetical protein